MFSPGEFGVVWKGYLENDGKERTVAVKCLRVLSSINFTFNVVVNSIYMYVNLLISNLSIAERIVYKVTARFFSRSIRYGSI